MNKPNFAPVLILAFALAGFTGAAQAQTITEVGTSSGPQMPGSPTDYIFFNSSNFPVTGIAENAPVPGNGTNAYTQLSSFSVWSGIVGDDGNPATSSSIITPAGGSPILTGDVRAFTPWTLNSVNGSAEGVNVTPGNNPNFNYNDFNVYVMYSTTGGVLHDTTISLDTSSTIFANDVAVTDTNVDQSSANYVEFNVKDFQSSGLPYFTVYSFADGPETYISGVSFQSVPEPTTWAMLFGGLGMLLVVRRFRGRLNI